MDTKEEADSENNKQVMMHMFHAYAAYSPRFQRAATTLLEEQSKPETEQQQQEVSQPPSSVIEADDRPSFAHIPPQSEVIREVKALFQRIIEDRDNLNPTATGTSLPFSTENSKTLISLHDYLSVFYRHSSLETSQELFWKIFEVHGVLSSLRVYVEALERCGNTKRKVEKNLALKFAYELWIKWCEEAALKTQTQDKKPNDPRLIERAHLAMVHVLAMWVVSTLCFALFSGLIPNIR